MTMKTRMNRCFLLLLVLVVAALAVCWPGGTVLGGDGKPAEFQLTDETVVRFATREEGIALLTAEDEFSRQLTTFDLQVRLKTTGDVSLDAWRKSVAEAVLDWSDDERQQVTAALTAIKPKLAKFRLPLPREVLLIHTSGKEESDAAYTRANAIALPTVVVNRSQRQLESLLIHELFHILSRHDRDVRRELYRVVGFELVPPIELPPSLQERKITNPDAPGIDSVIRLSVNGEDITAAPIIYATPAKFDPKLATSLFKYLTVRLLVLEMNDGKLVPKMMGQQPVVLDPRKVNAFYEKIGRNTNYIMHPDEILADNFIYLVEQRADLKTPRVVDGMAKVLAK